MYYDHWGLHDSPFAGRLDPRGFYANPVHDEALARLHFLVESRRRLGLLLGSHGRGKSLVLRVFADQLKGTTTRVVAMNLLGVDAQELLENLALGWGCFVDPGTSRAELWRQIADRLVEQRLTDQGCVLLLDDADEAEPAALTQIERLAHLDATAEGRLTIVLGSVPAGTRKLPLRLMELGDLRIDIDRWELSDTEGYIAHLLAAAGRQAPAFSPAALARLHELSAGAARQINQIADLAMAAAAGQGLELVDPHTVDSVCDELKVA